MKSNGVYKEGNNQLQSFILLNILHISVGIFPEPHPVYISKLRAYSLFYEARTIHGASDYSHHKNRPEKKRYLLTVCMYQE